MRLKNSLAMISITMILLTTLITVGFNGAFSAQETGNGKESGGRQTRQSVNRDYTSHSAGLGGNYQSSYPETLRGAPGTQGANIFSLDSFVRDLSSHKADKWVDLAYVNGDSAEFVIGVNSGQPDSYAKVNELIVENGGRLVNTVSIGGEVVALVADMPLSVVSSFVIQVQTSSFTRYVEPNMKFQTQLVPNDQYWSLQWGPRKIEADKAWDTTIGSSSVLVAVIDTGIDYLHPDLLNASYVPIGYDWVNKDSDPMDDNGHGTHVAGILAAVTNNRIGIAGLAQVSIMAEKGLSTGGWGTEDDLANAIFHAVDQGAKILSNSWGGPDSNLIHDAMKYAYDRDVLVVAAAGNSASSVKLYPAAYDEVVAVTATDEMDDPAIFTSFGDWVEVAAPGVNIYSTISFNHTIPVNYPYDYLSGTSMSTPHVSGTAALIWSQFPNVTRDWVRAQLRFTADDLGKPGFDKYYGYGRINARKAVEQALAAHDLLIYNWQRPKFVQPGDLVNFNVTVMNFGLNDENNMTVQFLTDGNVTDSKPIAFLAKGTLTTVSLLWNPILEARYNVTVWVEPLPGETRTANNAMSANINVQPIKVALFKNVDPWEYPANEEALDQYGVPYAIFSSDDFTRINITKFSKVIIASDQDQRFYDGMQRVGTAWLQNYAFEGGVLEIHAADYGWNGGRWAGPLPGGLQWNQYFSDYVTIVDLTHLVVNIPNPITDTELDEWRWSTHGYFTRYPQNSHIVIKEDTLGFPAYLEFEWGDGVIIASSQTLEWGYMRAQRSLILENSLLYNYVKYPHELAVILEAPAFLEPGHSALLNATVRNFGLNNETNVELHLLIDGSVVESHKADLPSGRAFTISYNFSSAVVTTYNVTAYAPQVPNEEFAFNNRMTRFVIVTYPLIRPIEGQQANYTLNYFDVTGRIIGAGYWNFTYDYYVEPYLINVTVWSKDPSGYEGTGWMIVNIMNRLVESDSGIYWTGMWYPGWIEININIGSTVNLLFGQATVSGTKILPVGIYPIDCWELPYWAYGFPYTFWYDKVSGLWIGMDSEAFIGGAKIRVELRLVETNIPIGTRYEHELAATLDAPFFLEPNTSLLVNATVHNIGLHTEKDVKLALLIDGAQVKSETIPDLLNGTSYTVRYLWTPTVEAKYNLTAYVQPVQGEVITENNAATKIVSVRIVKGYVLFDQTHWADSIFMYSIWISNLTNTGYIVDTLTLSPITSSALEGYDVFVIPQAHDYYFLSEVTAIQEFVLNGGGLLIIGDDSPYIYTDLTKFVGITWESGGYGGYTNDITPHPVTEGVNTAYFGSPMSRLFVSLPAQDIIRDNGRNVLLAVSEIKAGAVAAIADEDSINDWSILNADNLKLANNIIDWLKTRPPIASFTYSPLDPYVGETVTFNASTSYDPDGTIVSYLWNFGDGAFSAGVTTTHAYAAGGTYTVALTALDNEGLNSTVAKEVTVLRTTINVQVKVGSIHFRGEIAEFYVLVSSLGKPVDANISASIYYSGNLFANLRPFVKRVSLGLYTIPYTIPLNAAPGTYALVVEARYLSLSGISMESFLLSPTLTGWNALLVSINGTVGTIKTDLGFIKVDVNSINAKLASLNITVAKIQTDIGTITADIASIQLKVTAINGNIATIQTTLGTLEGRITSIEGDVATIETEIGTVRVDVGSMKEGQQAFVTPLYLIPILIIALGAITLVFLLRRKS